jgi:hemerythrin-like domain-containing protein
MNVPKNIVSILIMQHRGLQKDLGSIENILKKGDIDVPTIVTQLKQFTVDLKEHIELENNVFYVELIKQMKDRGQDTAKTEQFIAEMKEIGKSVKEFLDKYNSVEIIGQNLAEFKPEFENVVSILNLRIESEESGVYAYWGLI